MTTDRSEDVVASAEASAEMKTDHNSGFQLDELAQSMTTREQLATLLDTNLPDAEALLIHLLSARDRTDSQRCTMLELWTIEQERIAEASTDRLLAAIELNLKRARLYFKAGLFNRSWENFNDAHTQALTEGRYAIMRAIEAEMDAISNENV